MNRILLLAATFLLGACSNPLKQPKVRLGIAAQQSISQVPVYLAAQLGAYQSAGIDVELAEFPGASKGMEALLGGSIDVLSGYYTQALQVTAQGKRYEAFLPIYDSLLVALVVSPAAGNKILRIEDLKGAKIGVTTLGSATHQFIEFLLRNHGIGATEVTPIAIGTAARAAAAMERGIVDAGVVTDFTIRYLERRFGELRLLADTRTREGVRAAHGVDTFPGTALLASPEWLDRNGSTTGQLSGAVRVAMEWMRTHSAEEIAAKMPAAHYGNDKEAYVAAIRYAIPMLSSRTPTPESHDAAVRFLGMPQGTPAIWRGGFTR